MAFLTYITQGPFPARRARTCVTIDRINTSAAVYTRGALTLVGVWKQWQRWHGFMVVVQRSIQKWTKWNTTTQIHQGEMVAIIRIENSICVFFSYKSQSETTNHHSSVFQDPKNMTSGSSVKQYHGPGLENSWDSVTFGKLRLCSPVYSSSD